MALENNFQNPDAYEKLQFYYHPDHLGSSSYITNLDGEVVQHIEYVPFGEVFIEERNSIWNTPYLFNAKEFDEETGLYYYGARYYDPKLSLWISTDPKQIEYPWTSSYCYVLNNPIFYTDPNGCEVYISGVGSKSALEQLQHRAGKNLALTINNDGKLIYTIANPEEKLRGSAKIIAAIIDNANIKINLKTTDKKFTSTGNLFIGGAFMGNEIKVNEDGTISVVANQEVNPEVLDLMSNTHGKPGADMLHELTEAYEGALISTNQKKSSPASNNKNSVYNRAHNKATPQSGPVYQHLYDKDGNILENYEGVVKVDWYVIDKNNNPVVIQELE